MQSLREIISNRTEKTTNRKTNRFWIIASKIAFLTDTKPNRWLREVKNNEYAITRALIDLEELKDRARAPVALFIWLLKKHKSAKA